MRSGTGLARTGILRALIVLSLLSLAGCGAIRRCAYVPSGRAEWQQSERVLASLAIEPGSHIADLGAGGGYFTFALADAAGPSGTVYAADVDSDMTAYLEESAREDGYENVQVVLSDYDDPLLPEGVDLIFTSNTYHHIEDRVAYFRNARKYLRPGGRVAVIEYSEPGFLLGLIGHGHATPPDGIRREMEQAGYRLGERHGYLSRQSFQIFLLATD